MTILEECKEIYLRNKEWIDVESQKQQVHPDEYPFSNWYDEYINLGGKHSPKKFYNNIKVFNVIIPPTYCFDGFKIPSDTYDGEQWKDRREAFMCLIGYLNSIKESHRYFEAVDSVTTLS